MSADFEKYFQTVPPVLPAHIAIIMDGNGRWAQKRAMPRTAGHKAGIGSVRAVTEACARLGVQSLTLFAFSTENWQRPQKEVSVLMELFLRSLQKEVARLERNGIRLRIIGDRTQFSERLQVLMAEAEAKTAANDRLSLNIAASYGGRWDIVEAARRLAEEVAAGKLSPEAIDAERFHAHTALAELPEPDLFIRTGGEKRISNFLLWQLAYTELYFSDALWPDFREQDLALALEDYARRQRRFGRTSEQVEQVTRA